MTAPQGAQGGRPPRSSRGGASAPQWATRIRGFPAFSTWIGVLSRFGDFVQLPVLLLLLAGAVGSALWLSAGVEMRSFEQQRESGSTGALSASQIAQSFRSPRANLSRVELLLRSYAGLPEDGTVRLLEGAGLTGRPLYEAPLSKGRFNNPFLSFDFPALSASEGSTYTLALETPGRPLSSAMGVAYSNYDALTSGQFYTDGEPAEGELVFSTYYRYGFGTLLSDMEGAVTERGPLLISWILLLLLPGLALLIWLPNSFSGQQRFLAAPGLSALVLPVFYLLLHATGIRMTGLLLWLFLLLCAVAIIGRFLRTGRPARPGRVSTSDVAFWSALISIFVLTVATRLSSLRDLYAGMNLDAYHHTLITEMFVRSGGIPANYEPYAPLASFTYHFGFHALTASIAWLSGMDGTAHLLQLMPQAGQIACALPVLTLTLFTWKTTGNRWAGLAAGALAGLVSIFPAFYVNWSRYTQGLGLALLPVAWLLLLEALNVPRKVVSANDTPKTHTDWETALRHSGPFMLAVLGGAGLALTHYRITMIYAGFVAFYIAARIFQAIRVRSSFSEIGMPLLRAGLVAILTLATLLPWLLNLRENFTTRFVGKDSPERAIYYSLQTTLGGTDLLLHPSMPILVVLSAIGIIWIIRRRSLILLLPAVVWLVLGIWSNPYLLPFRLPYAGYLDVTTVVTGIWLPLALLAGLALSESARWVISLGDSYDTIRKRVWRVVVPLLLGIAILAGGAASSLSLATRLDNKPYIARGDAEALFWMRDNLPRDAYVLANPFAFSWDPPPQSVHGSDAGLWVPLVAGVRASVPPIPAYNERPAIPGYIDGLRALVGAEPFSGQEADWEALKSAGITHIYVGSRGGALDVQSLLTSDHSRLLYHSDGAWIFEIR